MSTPRSRRAFVHFALLLLGVFVATAILSALFLYLQFGHKTATAAGGLVLMVIPLLIAAGVTQAFAGYVRSKNKPVLKWLVQTAVQTPMGRHYYDKMVARGVYTCLKCLQVGLGTPPERCPHCNEPIRLPDPPDASPGQPPVVAVNLETNEPDVMADADSRGAAHPIDIPERPERAAVPSVEEQFAAGPDSFNDPSSADPFADSSDRNI